MKRLYERFFAHQLAKPSGLFGRFYMKSFLNRENLRSNQFALKHLQRGKMDVVLEIGFGGGWLIKELLKLPNKKVIGLDHSKTIVDAARSQVKGKGKQVEFHQGSAESLPFSDNTFSHVVTVHTAYFWKDPQQVAKELYRVLKPEGVVVVGIASKAKLETLPFTKEIFTLYHPQQLVELLQGAGFIDVALASYDPDAAEDSHCISAVKPRC